MIKLNLKNTKTSIPIYSGTETGLGEGTNFTKNVTSVLGQVSQLDISHLNPVTLLLILVKIIIIACFPLGLKVYEIRIITQLEGNKVQLEKTLSSKQKTLTDLKKQVENHGYLKEKALEYDNKKKFLKGLAFSRLIIPQLLDQVQSIIPQSVWLKKIEVKIQDKGGIQIQGESLSEDRANVFANSLKSIVDKGSVKMGTNDIKSPQGGGGFKIRFDLKAQLLQGRNF